MIQRKTRCRRAQRRGARPLGAARRRGLTLVEMTLAAAVLVAGLIGSLMFRYQAALGSRKAEVQETAARLAWALLQAWAGAGGQSGYPLYDLANPLDFDPTDPNDYDPADRDTLAILPGLEAYTNEPGPPVPPGFTPIDACNRPNYRIVTNGINYYATLSYADQPSLPRALSVCVAWIDSGGRWDGSAQPRAVSLITYAGE